MNFICHRRNYFIHLLRCCRSKNIEGGEDKEPIGCDGELIDAHDCSADEISNRKLANLSLKKKNRLNLFASPSEAL